ncbi:MAG: hypothetical protein WA045_05035, partial [Nitrospira sp.]
VILSLNPRDQEALSLCAGLSVPTTQGMAQSQEALHEKLVKTASLDSDRLHGEGMTSAFDSAVMATKDGANGLSSGVPRSEEMPIPIARSTASAAQKTRSSAIARLEQWLNLIQDRRRDPQASS